MKFDFSIPDDLQKELESLANFDEIAPKMLDAATPIIEKSIKLRLARHKRSGDLVESVSAHKAKATKGVYIGKVKFDGYSKHRYKKRSQTVANAQKAISLEYGTSKQRATPFLKQAVNDVEIQVVQKMQAVFNEEVSK